MSKLIDNIKRLAGLVKNETISGANTSARIGGLFEEIASELERKYDQTESEQILAAHNTATGSHQNIQDRIDHDFITLNQQLTGRINDVNANLTIAAQQISQDLATHSGNTAIHKTSEQIRSEIVDSNIPETVARIADIIARDTNTLQNANTYTDTAVNTLGSSVYRKPEIYTQVETNQQIQQHNENGAAHSDIRMSVSNLVNGSTIAKKSQYAEKLGTEADSYTKAQLDTKINKHIKAVSYNPANALFTFTFEDGTTQQIDTPVENTVQDGRLDTVTNELILVLVSGQEIRIPTYKLIKTYTGEETTTIQTDVSSDGKISVNLKQGVIDTVHLSQALQNAINSHQTKTGDTKDNITTFSDQSVRTNLTSGEQHTILFGKIKKWLTDLKNVAFTGAAADITEDANHKFVTSSEKATLAYYHVIIGGQLNNDLPNLGSGIYFLTNVEHPIYPTGFSGIMEIYSYPNGNRRVVFRPAYLEITQYGSPILTTGLWDADGYFDGWETVFGKY